MYLLFLLTTAVLALRKCIDPTCTCDIDDGELEKDSPYLTAPCVCEFSKECVALSMAETTLFTFQLIPTENRATITCNPGPNLILPHGHPKFNLSTTQDPDIHPKSIGIYWEIYSTPYSPDPPPFSFDGDRSHQKEITIDSSNLKSGNYSFILWCSDFHNIVPIAWNVTIREPEFVAEISPPEASETFNFFSGNEPGHECSIYPPSPSLYLSGVWPYAIDYPSVNLTYYWTQVSGPSLAYRCDEAGFVTTRAFFDTDKPIVQFVPGDIGLYCFQLIIGNNGSNSTPAEACVTVRADFRIQFIPRAINTYIHDNEAPFCQLDQILLVPYGSEKFTLDSSHCNDPDEGPDELTIRWHKSIGEGYEDEKMLPLDGNNEIDCMGLESGDYKYQIWVSDGDWGKYYDYVVRILPKEEEEAKEL